MHPNYAPSWVHYPKEIVLFLLVYIPVNATQGDQTIQLFVIAGTSVGNSNTTLGLVANYTWNIKVTQIDCSKNDVLQGILPKYVQ